MTNAEIARVLGQIATMLEMDGANAFRVRASHHPLAGQLVERLLGATLVDPVSGR